MDDEKPRMVGINHVALSVGDVEDALAFYRSLFAVEVRGRTSSAVFLDMGDQFLALSEPDEGGVDRHRHVGLVVDDPDAVEQRLDATDAQRLDTGGLDFLDPWGNRIQVVGYADVQFSKADHVAAGMGLRVEKSESALAELREKGLGPD